MTRAAGVGPFLPARGKTQVIDTNNAQTTGATGAGASAPPHASPVDVACARRTQSASSTTAASGSKWTRLPGQRSLVDVVPPRLSHETIATAGAPQRRAHALRKLSLGGWPSSSAAFAGDAQVHARRASPGRPTRVARAHLDLVLVVKTIVDDYLREIRPLFDRRRTYQRTVYRPGELLQFDLWEPRLCDPCRRRPADQRVRRFLRPAACGVADPEARDPEVNGALERSRRFVRTTFEPGRSFANELDYQHQLDGWCEKVNRRCARTSAGARTTA
jgi:hypothetical protein